MLRSFQVFACVVEWANELVVSKLPCHIITTVEVNISALNSCDSMKATA